VLRRVVAATVVIEFVVNLYVLPFAAEAIVLLIALLSFAMRAALRTNPSTDDPLTRMFIEGLLVAVGLFYLAYFFIRVFTDLDEFLTRKNAENFLVAPVLTVALIPFLYLVAWLSRREQENLRKRWRSAFNPPA
jgi:hypothetical protein